jgi:integrase/recombinase XerD
MIFETDTKYCERTHRLIGGDPVFLEKTNNFLLQVEARGLSLKTIRTYAFSLISLSRWLKDYKNRFADLNQSDLFYFIQYQKDQGASVNTINIRLIVAQVFFRFCYNYSIPNEGRALLPAPYYKGPGKDKYLGLHNRNHTYSQLLKVKRERKLIEPLTPNEIKRFLCSLTRYRDLSIVHLMLLCGLRSQETLSMQIEDIDILQNQIKVRGKGNKERMLPLPKELKDYLNKYINLERPKNTKSNYLFLIMQGKKRGKSMTTTGLRSLFRHRRMNYNVENANAHRWRHTFGSNMARANVQLPILQKMMGHANAETTLLYINLSTEDIAAEFAKAMENIKKRYEKTC